MKRIIFLFIIVGLCGCASLNSQVFREIKEGDTEERLVQELGEPDAIQESVRIPSAKAFIYTRRSERCGFTIDEGIVKFITCDENPNYVNPLAALFSGFSQGMQNSNTSQAYRQPINCTSTQLGNTINTSCY